MAWIEKEIDWASISNEIKVLLAHHKGSIPADRILDIEHYIEHGELSSAFEYLVLEMIEGGVRKSDVDSLRLNDLALLFDLDDENECMIDSDFWSKLQRFVSQT